MFHYLVHIDKESPIFKLTKINQRNIEYCTALPKNYSNNTSTTVKKLTHDSLTPCVSLGSHLTSHKIKDFHSHFLSLLLTTLQKTQTSLNNSIYLTHSLTESHNKPQNQHQQQTHKRQRLTEKGEVFKRERGPCRPYLCFLD